MHPVAIDQAVGVRGNSASSLSLIWPISTNDEDVASSEIHFGWAATM